jgi:hypothetical protein
LRQKLLSLFSRLGLVLLGLLFGLVVLEIGFRILYPDPSPKLVNQGLQFHETYRLAFKPGAAGWNTSLRGEYSTYVQINEKGLRGQEYPYTKAEDVFRVLVLGDSFTAGLQVEEAETFPKLLETQLNRHSPQLKVEVVNAGVIGYGTDNQLAYFTYEGYKYQPDLVILAFFTGNDLTDNIWYSLYDLKEGQLVPAPVIHREDNLTPNWAKEGSLFKNIRNSLYTHSRLYSVSIELLTLSAIQKTPALAQWLVSLGFVEMTRPLVNYGNLYAFRYLPDEAWEKTEALIRALNQEVERRGSRLLVVILPDETEVDDQRRQEILASYSNLTKPQTLVGPPPSEHLAEILQQDGITYLELLPVLKDNYPKNQTPLYYRYDGHWTPAGHRLAGQAIYEYLITHQAAFLKPE